MQRAAGDAVRSAMARSINDTVNAVPGVFDTATQPFMPRLDDAAQVALKAKSRLGDSMMRCPRNGLILPGHAGALLTAVCRWNAPHRNGTPRHLSLIGGRTVGSARRGGTQRLESADRMKGHDMTRGLGFLRSVQERRLTQRQQSLSRPITQLYQPTTAEHCATLTEQTSRRGYVFSTIDSEKSHDANIAEPSREHQANIRRIFSVHFVHARALIEELKELAKLVRGIQLAS